jgi:hypothetical protein
MIKLLVASTAILSLTTSVEAQVIKTSEGEFISRIQREEVKKTALNNCGWGLVSMKAADGTLYFKGQQYRYSQLPRTVRPPVCRRINGNWITYFAIPLGQ